MIGEFVECRVELLERQLDALAQRLDSVEFSAASAASRLSRTGSSCAGEVLQRVLVGVGDVGLCALADVVGFRLGAQPRIVVLLRLELELA